MATVGERPADPAGSVSRGGVAAPQFTGRPLTGEDPGFLSKLNLALAAHGVTQVRVESAYRSPAYNAQVGGAGNSNHTYGRAIDASAFVPGTGWVPVGTLLRSDASRYGLRSGDVPGFFNGAPDPNHVDDGFNHGQASARYKAFQSTGLSVAPTGNAAKGLTGALVAEAKALAQDRWYPGGSQGTAGKALGSLSSIGDLIGFVTSIRFVELIGGFALIIIGLVSLTREFGIKTPIPNIPMASARPA